MKIACQYVRSGLSMGVIPHDFGNPGGFCENTVGDCGNGSHYCECRDVGVGGSVVRMPVFVPVVGACFVYICSTYL